MPNVVTYCRVSSDEQAQKDLSIPAQRKALGRWIDERDEIDLADQFVDEGKSAYAPADKRPGFCSRAPCACFQWRVAGDGRDQRIAELEAKVEQLVKRVADRVARDAVVADLRRRLEGVL